MNTIFIYPQSSFGARLRSDTLWGMIITGISRLYGGDRVSTLLSRFEKDDSPFLLSSVFPFVTLGNRRTLLLPRPLIANSSRRDRVRGRCMTGNEREDWKRFIRHEFVSLDGFRQWIAGELDEDEYFESRMWEKIPSPFIERDRVRRAVTNHDPTGAQRCVHGSEEIFMRGDFRASPESDQAPSAGLYLLCEGDIEIVLAALRCMSHFGFGGEVSTGKGAFRIDHDADLRVDFDRPPDPTHQVILSLFAPTTDELARIRANRGACWYDLEKRQGRPGPDHPGGIGAKDAVMMFREGSVFPWTGAALRGRVDIVAHTRAHAIRQCGRPLSVPAVFKGGE